MNYTLEGSDPPFEETYKELFVKDKDLATTFITSSISTDTTIEELQLPMVDLSRLGEKASEEERESCKREMMVASREWGFFQVVNHGISPNILEDMRKEQVKAFREPFNKKKSDKCMNLSLSPGSYRWGTPTATCLRQLAWSEAFHIPLADLSFHANANDDDHLSMSTLNSTVTQFASTVSELALKLANILAEKLGHDESQFFEKNCLPNTCYVRMNRYLPCPNYPHVFGLMPHTDSDFLTILYQDQVGGLQLVKDGNWIAVKPNPQALIVNIGDLFQAWSNNVYKSVEHRVVTSSKVERFSTAYFLCPSYDVVVQSHKEPSIYKKFSFGEYRQQVQDDVSKLGSKKGLSRFLDLSDY